MSDQKKKPKIEDEGVRDSSTSESYEFLPHSKRTSTESEQKNLVGHADYHRKQEERERFGPPEIDPSDIEYFEDSDYLGEGTFGKVYKGRCRGKAVAVKVPIKQKLRPAELQDFRSEVSIMSKIFHPNVVLFMGACTKPDQIRIVTELCQTDMEKLLHSVEGKKIPLYQRIKMAKDAALGMNWLHGITKIIHRDLKLANLLVDDNFKVKVTDFGFSQVFIEDKPAKDKFGPRGTAIWMAPEVMNQEEFGSKIDVYSFGICLWEIYSLKEPFSQYSDWDSFFEAVCIDGERPEIDGKCSSPLKYLMRKCWHREPSRRPDFDEIVFRLDEVLVNLAISDEDGRNFWIKHFLQPKHALEEKIKWSVFSKVLSKETKIKDLEKLEPLKDLMIDSKGFVDIKKFEKMIIWFGGFFVEKFAKDTIGEITELLKQDYFHGDIDKITAESRLDFRKNGTFLVRLSSTLAQYPFTVSSTKKQHRRIKRTVKEDGSRSYSISTNKKGIKSFNSITSLIKECAKDLSLRVACPQSVFENPYE